MITASRGVVRPPVPILLLALLAGLSRLSHAQASTLNGKWQLTLVLDSAKLLHGAPTGDTVRGSMSIGPEFRTFSMHPTVDTVGAIFGTHDLNLTPFWGGPIPPEFSTSVLSGGKTSPITEVFLRLFRGDSVVLTLNPRFSHGPVKLTGRLRADSVGGTWELQSYRSTAAGHFWMVRDSVP